MVYLKTIFSAPNEIKFLKLNLQEGFDFIDKFIVCEFNRTHSGLERNLIFKNFYNEFSSEEHSKIIYIDADISTQAVVARNSEEAHKNELLMRGFFASQVDLMPHDIIISVDADEIIFNQAYKLIFRHLRWPWQKVVRLPLRQFFYKINYLWEDKIINNPIACKAGFYENIYPAQWRDVGQSLPQFVGCHFSWCLTVDEMIQKLNSYAHANDYAHCAKRDVLEDAIKYKKYPFDLNVDFRIKVLDIYKNSEFYPKSIYPILQEFRYILDI